DRKVRRHRRRVDRPRYSAADDDLVRLSHATVLPLSSALSTTNRFLRPALVGGERDQTALPPRLALDETIGAEDCAPLGLDAVHDRAAPVGAPLGRGKDTGVDALITFGIVSHAAGRVEVYGLERPHEGPAQGEPIADPDVDVLNAGYSLLDEAEGFLQERALQPVHDEAVDLALHHDRGVACVAQELRRALDGGRIRPWRGNDFSGGNEIGRIDRMDDETARAAFEVGGKGR